jgi:hypothetical protein
MPTSNVSKRESKDDYYEDVDPRFAEPTSMGAGPSIPASLMPGNGGNGGNGGHQGGYARGDSGVLPQGEHPSLEELHKSNTSPAPSNDSRFTSISQRGVNPNWRPAPQGPPPGSQRVQQQREVLLTGNQDFELPGGRGRGGGRGNVPNNRYPAEI